MNALLTPANEMPERPDLAWIRSAIPIREVASQLGIQVRGNVAQCWRTGNHAHGDADPSLRFHLKKNRARCFVCDTRYGHSTIDLVMGVLGCNLQGAVAWFCERYPVPATGRSRVGRPKGSYAKPAPFRVGVTGSDFETLIRSGLWAGMFPSEQSILTVLHHFRDLDTGITTMSYRAIARYSGVAHPAAISRAIRNLSAYGALQVRKGALTVGATRKCSSYIVTLNDPKLIDRMNATYRRMRGEISIERGLRSEMRTSRQLVTCKGGFRPPAPPALSLPSNSQGTESLAPPTSIFKYRLLETKLHCSCKGLLLSSLREVIPNKPLPLGKREIGILHRDTPKTRDGRVN